MKHLYFFLIVYAFWYASNMLAINLDFNTGMIRNNITDSMTTFTSDKDHIFFKKKKFHESQLLTKISF